MKGYKYMDEIKRGDIFYGKLPEGKGSVQGGVRPVLILQNDTGNRYSPTVIVASITSSETKSKIPTHVKINKSGLTSESIILLEQIATLDKSDLIEKVDSLDFREIRAVNRALGISIDLVN